MAEYIIMPKLGFDMDRGTLVRWIKKEGDFIKEQEVVFEIETDKTIMEVEAQISGVLRKIFVAEGEEVPVTLPIAIVAEEDEDIRKMIDEAYRNLGKIEISEKEEFKVEKKVFTVTEEKQKTKPKETKKEVKKISPRALKKAKELGIELQSFKGSGPGNVVIEKDVISYFQTHKGEKAISFTQNQTAKTKLSPETVKNFGTDTKIMKNNVKEKTLYSGMRKIIGDRLSQSKFTAPHIYFTTSVDMSEATNLLKKLNQPAEKKISINDFLIFIVAKTLSEHPDINCSLLNEEIVYHKDINIGVAVAIKEGLIVPVVKNANKKNLSILSVETKKLIKLARERKLMPEDCKDGTFTISNLGMYGIENFTAIINPPEAAILAVGAIQRAPIVIEGNKEIIEIRPIMKLTLSADHRLIDGVTASNFLTKTKYYLQQPKFLVL